MKHYIIVKFKEQINVGLLTEPITELFRKLTEMNGIHDVNVYTSCIDRPNRYDIMIEINMDKAALECYDHSDVHIKWKQEYSEMIENKAIFDCE
ncbi:MAG: hypothetical protein J6K92_05320 [Oscillospiraceae bacterium]|nr:hypothetical protein [Oscillospiraceae bacterium]